MRWSLAFTALSDAEAILLRLEMLWACRVKMPCGNGWPAQSEPAFAVLPLPRGIIGPDSL